jgi:hypothetical protein
MIKSKYPEQLNYIYVSSDQIKGKLIKKHLVNFPNADTDKIHDKIRKQANQEFEQIIKTKARTDSEKGKINLFFVDKNFPIDGIESLKR